LPTSPCLIGMEACASAHFWANKLISMGHNVDGPSVRQTLC
jgi:transposase